MSPLKSASWIGGRYQLVGAPLDRRQDGQIFEFPKRTVTDWCERQFFLAGRLCCLLIEDQVEFIGSFASPVLIAMKFTLRLGGSLSLPWTLVFSFHQTIKNSIQMFTIN